MTTASIVIYKSDRQELETVLSCTVQSIVEKIWVIDNSPTDELKWVVGVSSKIEYVFGQGNIGYGAAHNIAIHNSIRYGAKYHVIINPDISFSNQAITILADFMDENPQVGQLMPKVVCPNGELQYLCKLLPSPMDLIGRKFIPFKSYVLKRNYRYEMHNFDYNSVKEVPNLSGCFMFCRVDALNKVGGFDDNFFMYCEDIDLCRRIGMSGYKTMYNPSVTIVHAHKKESFRNKKMLKAHIKSAIRYFNKWGWVFDNYRHKINKIAK